MALRQARLWRLALFVSRHTPTDGLGLTSTNDSDLVFLPGLRYLLHEPQRNGPLLKGK